MEHFQLKNYRGRIVTLAIFDFLTFIISLVMLFLALQSKSKLIEVFEIVAPLFLQFLTTLLLLRFFNNKNYVFIAYLTSFPSWFSSIFIGAKSLLVIK